MLVRRLVSTLKSNIRWNGSMANTSVQTTLNATRLWTLFWQTYFVTLALDVLYFHRLIRTFALCNYFDFENINLIVALRLTLKQNKYPVLFLNQGRTDKHMDYVDPRTQTSEMAVRFAAGTGLAGVNLHSEDLIKNHDSISLAKHYGLITFVWGDELTDKSVATRFKNEFGVDGLIFDRIGESETRNNVFLLERAKKQALFGSKKPPSPIQSPKHKQSFASNVEVNMAALAEHVPVTTTAAIEHLDLGVTNGSITVNSKIQAPTLFSSAHSSTSSGISDTSSITTAAAPPTLRRQHYSFSQGQPLSTAFDV